ncbi:hypothetical protein Tco_1067986 [Tanacetum coccineum]|uniref:Uncharacterized protein n=1 Tax=Tanacetum coccineum TaxID=301880 RepID=A0ABQ5HFC7_9ASTR
MTNKSFLEYTRIKAKDFRDTLLKDMKSIKKSIAERAHHQRQYDRRVNEIQMQRQEGEVDRVKALDVDLVVTESSRTERENHDTSSKSGNDTHAIDADIKPVNDKETMAEKSSAVHEKPNNSRSCLRWKPTGRIFKIASLRSIPTGKMFTDDTTKVDSEPSDGSNDDITNSYECDQTLNVSAVQASDLNVIKMTSVHISLGLAL